MMHRNWQRCSSSSVSPGVFTAEDQLQTWTVSKLGELDPAPLSVKPHARINHGPGYAPASRALYP